MDLARKLDYARAHVTGISRHDDEQLEVRVTGLNQLKAFIDAEIAEAQGRHDAAVEARIAALASSAE